VTEVQDGTFITMEVMGCQVHAIGKAIRLLFADPVTYIDTSFIIIMYTMSMEEVMCYIICYAIVE